MNGLSSLDEIYGEYSLAPADDLFRFGRSKVKVTAGRLCGEGIHVDAGASEVYLVLHTRICLLTCIAQYARN